MGKGMEGLLVGHRVARPLRGFANGRGCLLGGHRLIENLLGSQKSLVFTRQWTPTARKAEGGGGRREPTKEAETRTHGDGWASRHKIKGYKGITKGKGVLCPCLLLIIITT